MPTKQVPIRFTDADRERISRIREHYGLSSDAEAVRVALKQCDDRIASPHTRPTSDTLYGK